VISYRPAVSRAALPCRRLKPRARGRSGQ
jgi:hypothetical protein